MFDYGTGEMRRADAVWLICMFAILIVAVDTWEIADCSETECGPRVSKCMLLKSCNCSITRENLINKNCTCCRDCIKCLDKQFFQCCACLGLCHIPDEEVHLMGAVVKRIKEDEGMKFLFDDFTAVHPVGGVAFTFPVAQEFPDNGNEGKEMKYIREAKSGSNCTVVYIDKCVSTAECVRKCGLMGASTIRWFQNGCCECIGHTCLSFGSELVRCKYCADFDGEEPTPRNTEL